MEKLKRVLLAAVLLVTSGFVWTHPAQAQTQTQQAEGGEVYAMPAGDFRGAPDAAVSAGREIRRRTPVAAAELARLKSLDGDAGPADAGADADAGAGPQAVFTSCAMQSANGFAPSDVHGAAGPTNIIEVTNVFVQVRNKTTCALVSGVTLKTFFNNFAIPAAETLFDPRVLYDRLGGRCLLTAESSTTGSTNQFLYIASSLTSSCTSWRRIRFVLSRISPAALFCKALASDFYDFPNAGYNNRRLVVTSNNFPAAGGSYGTVLSIDKIALYGGATVVGKCFRPVPINIAPAVVGDTSTSMYLLAAGSGSGSSVGRRRLNTAGAVTADTLTTLASIPITAWSAPPDAPQPNGQRLDTLDGRFQSASKQIGGLIWQVRAVNVGGRSRARMYKFSTTGGQLLTFTPTTSTCANVDHLFNPSIDTNSTVTTSLAYMTMSRTCPSQAAAGRAAHLILRGPNSSSVGWVFNTIATSATQFLGCNTMPRGSCRWGDYSSTQIDPTTPATAWGFNQLVTGTTQFSWGTRVARVGP